MENTISLMYNAGDSFTLLSITSDLTISVEARYCLLPNNTKEYEVTGDYNPAHKKYVDEAVVANSYKVLPGEVLEITQDMASDDIFAKFGGKSAYLDFVKNTPTDSIIRVEGGALCVASMISYTNDNTSTLDIQTLGLNASQYIRVTVSSGTASALTVKYIFVNESDVLKKNNTTAYTPTQNYHPATKKYADASSLYKVYNLGLNVIDRTGVLLLWEAEKDEYNATVYRGIMMGSLCTIPLNGITQAGGVPLVSMFASFRKIGENNETDFMYARGSSYIRVAPATVIYNNKDYTALQIEVSGEADIMNFVGYFNRPPLLTWVPYLEETGSGTVILNEEINNNIEVSAAKELVGSSDVLTKTNTSAYTPTQPYHPATKKYVDDKVYVVNNSTWEEVLRNNKSINGTDVQALVNKLFGSYSEFLSLLQGVNDNVYIGLKFTDWMYDDANGYGVGSSYTASNLYAKHNTAEGEFNCNFTYFYKNALKCCIISVNEASNHNYDKLIIQDIVTSDNLTTITKKTAAEYEALGSKDANTAYCVTD